MRKEGVNLVESNISKIKDLDSLLEYLVDELEWPILLDEIEPEEYSFNYDPVDFNLSSEFGAEINQLRPLVQDQPWGIFIVEFEHKNLPISALRKILFGLVPSKRNNDSESPKWNKENLIFICFFGEKDNRTIAFIHFDESSKVLPSLKSFYWQPSLETNFHSINEGLSKLKWPENEEDSIGWITNWSSAFSSGYRERVKTSIDLSTKLASLAKKTKDLIQEVYNVESKNGPLHNLYESFKEELIHDLSVSEFADMYAQTVAYGLFYARIMNKSNDFEISEVVELIPNTNPFLKELLKKCFEHGYGKDSKLDFDELEIGEIVYLLSATNTDKILDDFGRRTGGGTEDPVIHFYEGFLNEYQKEQRKERGVFYTPDPVVEFIVKSVDLILKNDFSFEKGLADSSTRKVKIKRESKRKNKNGLYGIVEDTKDVPSIQILDPATGTGTFLKQVIQLIKNQFDKDFITESNEDSKNEWNKYVSKSLLPRIFGFEIMMAPYAIAHMKIGLLLKETGYDFNNDERLNILLTNALEAPEFEKRTIFNFNALSEESNLANEVKNNQSVNIVIGNPPYLADSSNENEFIRNLLRGVDLDGSSTESYFEINGKPLGERNPRWLNDDYVKFLRLGHHLISRTDGGILAFITNHGYLSNPTFRGMREKLFKSFDYIYIIDLHGNSKYREVAPDGSIDENVFNIQQGVAIAILVKRSDKKNINSKVFHLDLWGDKTYKYKWLKNNTVDSIDWIELKPSLPDYLFIPRNDNLYSDYIKDSWKITDIFPVNSVGVVTARDHFVLQWSIEDTWKTINDFITQPTEIAREKYQLRKDVVEWKVKLAQDDLKKSNIKKNKVVPFLYRPFDIRYTYYTGRSKGFMCRPRPEVMTHLIDIDDNLALLTARSNKSPKPDHFFCTRYISEAKAAESTTQSANFPLYIKSELSLKNYVKQPNISKDFIKELTDKLGLTFIKTGNGNLTETIGPEDIFYYIYAIFYSNGYRETYSEFLKSDFPRVKITRNLELFRSLVKYGSKLVKLHLMEINLETNINFVNPNYNKVIDKVSYKQKELEVWINNTSYFTGIDRWVWEFEVGGYSLCKKWLNYRKGKELTNDDLEHFKQIVEIIKETKVLMGNIDSLIQKNINSLY
ncbi:N-6 DNA methylase [Aquisalibacillus elongatus]|uniref:site-specific DNA-methyltransferase (adenine-specific) n=1 Tax=Aquisalibacillus elongatus TaxID=485577 RepID=A0A3N5BBX9_9BACI|nr:N-6 DNA methylase [Aquisalibacillus elongatus]